MHIQKGISWRLLFSLFLQLANGAEMLENKVSQRFLQKANDTTTHTHKAPWLCFDHISSAWRKGKCTYHIEWQNAAEIGDVAAEVVSGDTVALGIGLNPMW
jgi:hypothetical protein